MPTRDRPQSLRVCLAALEAQAAPSFEIVVVDDGSREPGEVEEAVSAAPRARLVRGHGRGPAAARNLGAAEARAPVVCFTDDDCRPEPGWLAALTARLEQDRSIAAVAGPTLAGDPGNVYATASQVITTQLTESSLDQATGQLGFAPTTNLACRTDVLGRVAFDESFPLAAGEDRDWCLRLGEAGHRLVFEPGARVGHDQRLTAGGFWRQQCRYGRGAYRYHRRHPGHRPSARFYLGLVRSGFRHGWRVGLLVVVAQVAVVVGVVAEAGRAIRGFAPKRGFAPGKSGRKPSDGMKPSDAIDGSRGDQ